MCLHECSKTHIIIEVAIQTQNVRVSEMRLDLHLSSQLVLNIRVTKLVLEQNLQIIQRASVIPIMIKHARSNTSEVTHRCTAAYLQGNYELGLSLPSKVYISKFAASQGFSYVKVSKLPASIFVAIADRASTAGTSK